MSLEAVNQRNDRPVGDATTLAVPTESDSDQRMDVHVVILTNYVRALHVASYQELAKRVRKLTILLSVPMEPDRHWDAEWADLDVRVQKNWMFSLNWRHSIGFKETNFVHVPIDTISQLKSLNPDIVFSCEMGMRTLLASWFRRSRPDVPLVMVGNMSDHIESDRGFLRRSFRWLVKKRVDYFTYNGPSCRRYLKSLGVRDEQLFPLPYSIDPEKLYRGERQPAEDSDEIPRRLFYASAISERKGIIQFMTALKRWCQANPQRKIDLTIAGTGELQDKVASYSTQNLTMNFLGNLDNAGLRNAYRDTDICVFPTLADEWGLVPVEAMISGVPVLGSRYAQSIETLVEEGSNGWVFDPTDSKSIEDAIDRGLQCSGTELHEMGDRERASVAHVSPATTADKIFQIIKTVLPKHR